MTGKTFAEYEAQYAKEPFQLPMPGGGSVAIPQPALKVEIAAVDSANSGANLASGLLKGLLVYVPEADREKVSEAWGTLPSSALNAVIAEMRTYFGTKNS